MTFAQTTVLGVGAAGPVQLLKFWNVLGQPLQSEPGKEYAYVNSNWIIAAYILEQGWVGQAYMGWGWLIWVGAGLYFGG